MVTCAEKLAKIQQDYADLIQQGIITLGPNPCPPGPPVPPADFDEFGTKMLHKVTGKKVDMKVGGDPAGNGQRYNANHRFQNYMQIGYYKTGKGQKVIEMKTDGPNHGSCKKLNQCMWYEPHIRCSDGGIEFGGEWPHPKNHAGLRMDFHEDVQGGIKEQWIGYAVCAYDNAQGQRVIEQWDCKNPFGADGKPTNNWHMNMKSTETGDGKMFPKDQLPRKLPTDYDPKGKTPPRGLEAEIRMHGESKGHGNPGGTNMKWARVWELAVPVV